MVMMYKGVAAKATGELTGEEARLLPLCLEPKSRKELMELLGLKQEEPFRTAYLLPANGSHHQGP